MSADFSLLTPECVLNAVEQATGQRCTGVIRPLPSYINRVYTVEMDSGEIRATTTRSNAQMLGAEPSRGCPGHTAVIFLEGITGCYNLSRVRPKGGLSRA